MNEKMNSNQSNLQSIGQNIDKIKPNYNEMKNINDIKPNNNNEMKNIEKIKPNYNNEIKNIDDIKPNNKNSIDDNYKVEELNKMNEIKENKIEIEIIGESQEKNPVLVLLR